MMTSTQLRVVIPTGLALFAMFFGAGNAVFPLKIGSISGQHLWAGLIAFLISGVGVPFLGLFAVSLYGGDYWKFFARIGKVPSFIVVTFLILIIGPLVAAPRTATVAYGTLLATLSTTSANQPSFLQGPYFFNFIYFALVWLVVAKQSRVVDIIGWLLSPIKIATFIILIIAGLFSANHILPVQTSASEIFSIAWTTGYGTMDLLASVFFCTVAYRNIVSKCVEANIYSEKDVIKMTMFACVIGAALICLIYMGLVVVASGHAQDLQNLSTEAEILGKISYVILGPYGSLIIGLCVTFVCLATASALAEVTTEYIHETVLRGKVPRYICLATILVVMYLMAITGFNGIMAVAGPILNVVYPALIALCVFNIIWKLLGFAD